MIKGVLIVVLLGMSTHCAVSTASAHQLASLEATCQCRCAWLSIEEARTLPDWASHLGDGLYHLAWGGGVWKCEAR